MKKIRISESELVNLIEKLVKETIMNGLLFMRIKGEYLGMSEVDSGV
jgi:hypothetical protein